MLDPQRNTAELNGEALAVSEWAKLNGTGNDGPATVVVTHHMSSADRRNFMSGRDTKKEISRLNIDGTNAYGMTLSPDVLSCNADGIRSYSVEWYHNDEPCDDETTMVAGKYQAKVEVMLESDYVFSASPNFSIMGDRVSDYELSATKRAVTLWSKVYNLECNHSYNEDEHLHFDNDKHFMQCSVCEKVLLNEKHDFLDGEKAEGAIVYKCRTCDFSYGEADDGKVRIDYINVNVPDPKTGYTPEYFGLISGEGISFADGGDEFTKNGIRWGLYVNDSGVAENALFTSGMRYRATIYLRADEGYTFSKDQNAQYNPVVIVNGEAAEFETDGTLMTVKYEVNAPEISVSYINMSGIDFPEVGKTADRESESDEPNYYECDNISWYEDGEYMGYDDTFKEGKAYTVEMYIDTIRSGWDYTAKFAESVSASVDGFYVESDDIERFHDTSVRISYTFPILEEEKVEEPEKPTQTEKPQETKSNPFVDVIKGQYYYDAVLWAAENGITGGTSANTFSPDANCSRGQVVTFLYRMIGSPEPAAITLPFADVKTSDYFYKPVKLAFGSKITGGTSDTTFSPDETCSRAQVVTFLWRTAGQPEPKGKNNPFADVKSDSYYYKAVLWAVEQGITGGTSASTFSPDNNCTRAQVVTFLYRFINKQ